MENIDHQYELGAQSGSGYCIFIMAFSCVLRLKQIIASP